MINISHLSFSYDDEIIFDDANLSLPSKGIYILRGNNGCGKTTLFKLLLGDLNIQKGQIIINDIEINKKNKNIIKLN